MILNSPSDNEHIKVLGKLEEKYKKKKATTVQKQSNRQFLKSAPV